jgi:hypothetical protein
LNIAAAYSVAGRPGVGVWSGTEPAIRGRHGSSDDQSASMQRLAEVTPDTAREGPQHAWAPLWIAVGLASQATMAIIAAHGRRTAEAQSLLQDGVNFLAAVPGSTSDPALGDPNAQGHQRHGHADMAKWGIRLLRTLLEAPEGWLRGLSLCRRGGDCAMPFFNGASGKQRSAYCSEACQKAAQRKLATDLAERAPEPQPGRRDVAIERGRDGGQR